MEELTTFISIDWIKPLVKKLAQIRDERAEELRKIGDVFGDPELLARYYIEPECQHHNPADYHEEEDPVSYVKTPAFTTVNKFLNRDIRVYPNLSRKIYHKFNKLLLLIRSRSSSVLPRRSVGRRWISVDNRWDARNEHRNVP